MNEDEKILFESIKEAGEKGDVLALKNLISSKQLSPFLHGIATFFYLNTEDYLKQEELAKQEIYKRIQELQEKEDAQ